MIKRSSLRRRNWSLLISPPKYVKVGGTNTTFMSFVWNLWFIITADMTSDRQITAVCQSAIMSNLRSARLNPLNIYHQSSTDSQNSQSLQCVPWFLFAPSEAVKTDWWCQKRQTDRAELRQKHHRSQGQIICQRLLLRDEVMLCK